jgi:hypothetical protein
MSTDEDAVKNSWKEQPITDTGTFKLCVFMLYFTSFYNKKRVIKDLKAM